MSFTDETVRFEFDDSSKKEIGETLVSVYKSLGEKGYNPINQMVGYVLSGDPAYIPRHNDARNKIRRFDRDDIVEELIKNYVKDKNLTFHKFSNKEDFSSDIVLVDIMGILNDIYEISDIAILGGAFSKIGGHNPIEPAFFGNVIISGKNIFNQKSLFECIKNYYLIENSELKEYLEKANTLLKPELTKEGSFEPIIKEIKKWQ